MEEKIRMRPCTPRTVELKTEDFSELQDPSEILASISGLTPSVLPNLLKLELKLNCEEVAVHKFGELCPNMKELKLNDSNIDSLRTLGTKWSNLEILWLVRTGLSEIDGISAFPKLKELYCAFNSIISLAALMFHENIQVLDVEGNKIADWAEVDYLQFCSALWSVNFEGNPINKEPNYRQKVLQSLEQIIILDDISKDIVIETPVQESEELELIRNSVRESAIIRNKSQMSTRPSTAKNIFQEEVSHLTEEVFSGNPLKAMRFRRKKLFQGGEDDMMNLIREFKFDDSKGSVQPSKRPVIVKNKNIVIRSVGREGFYDTR